MRVSALRRSLKVPPERMLRKNARSDAEPPVAFGKAEKVASSDVCKEEARSSKLAIWEADWETTGIEVVGSGGRKLNQSGDAGMSSLALEEGISGNYPLLPAAHRVSAFPAAPPSCCGAPLFATA